MDLNKQYAAHQQALMSSRTTESDADRQGHLARARRIAGEIGSFQHSLGAAASCAWCASHFAATPSV
ncbi:hypothetical protein [Aurantiacibacter hainanensis]|uniref:hypothetical protein n=1 Tax=Aurantiacibacter hainanensis TaxID=3076114 RepID=UPI0030C745B9